MAVTKAHPGVKAHIIVNGTRLVEFDDDDAEAGDNRVSKYVECQSGAEFEVLCKVSRPWPRCDLALHVYCDGKWAAGRLICKKDQNGKAVSETINGHNYGRDNDWHLEKFCFSELTIDTSGAPTVKDTSMKKLEELGEITLKVHRVKITKPSGKVCISKDHLGLSSVPEKALKGRALSHQSRSTTVALQSLLIIPRTPSPVPLEERELDTLTPEESLELIRRMRERELSSVAIKRERMKREHSCERNGTEIKAGDSVSGEKSFVSSKRRCLPATINKDGFEIIDLT
ncbi:hypothetical protein LEMA_P047680.1 [Plenodomus lingam JN3]|uniref:DUF7918 domain-containing protein n=1 Tax=Leptosphaeria maculans (strain JN3 / isolate v23.1.3 / race Av1-4-5-6-7-8) TaxID=985895 RepID=E5R592_LEPMJ|nr:hypothetical protein LEMA_P047680.1 [Plenodomus lingam JN3]CBX92062.1 hypothetical protein LEMA_P047680.1 [Plenodomus lingam JN3]